MAFVTETADPFADLHHETQSALAFFWMGRLIRIRRRWYRSPAERANADQLEQECLDALQAMEEHLGRKYLDWVHTVIKAKQQVANDTRQPVTIPKR